MIIKNNYYESAQIEQYNCYTNNAGEQTIVKNLSTYTQGHKSMSWVFNEDVVGLNIDQYLDCRELAKSDTRLANLLDELKTVYYLIKYD